MPVKLNNNNSKYYYYVIRDLFFTISEYITSYFLTCFGLTPNTA